MGLRGAVYTRGYPLSPSEGEVGEVYAGSSPTYRASLLSLSLRHPLTTIPGTTLSTTKVRLRKFVGASRTGPRTSLMLGGG